MVNAVKNNPSYLDVLPDVQLRYALTSELSHCAPSTPAALLVPLPTSWFPTSRKTQPPALSPSPSATQLCVPSTPTTTTCSTRTSLHPLGLIQAGFFFKQLTAPAGSHFHSGHHQRRQPSRGLHSACGTCRSSRIIPGDAISITVNGQNAYLYGFEASYQQHLSFLPGFLSGFGINANYGYSSSQEKGLPLRLDQPRMIDQATNTWRISPTYDNKRFSARVGLAYDGPSLFQYMLHFAVLLVAGADPSGLGPAGPSGDIWTLAHFQVDAQASYRIWRGMSAKVVGLNLNNEVFGYYQGSTSS